MEHNEPGRRRFFRYKVLEDTEILQRAREHGFLQRAKCLDCCSCASLPRCLSFCRFFLLFSTSLFLAMAPWTMAITEALVIFLLYLFVVHPDGVSPYHYSWWSTEQDVVVLSGTRSLVALVSFFLGMGRNLHVPYMVVAGAFAGIGLPFVAVKAVMLRRPLISKWGVLLLASALFSVAHIIVAMTANSLARRRYQMGLLGQDEEQPLADSRCWKRHATDESEVPAAHLADELSKFIDCKGLLVHYYVEQPEVERDPDAGIVLIHGFGAGTFAWRHIMSKLAHQAQCRVYAFDRPGFGLTSRPLVTPHAQCQDPGNPYRLQFQADLVLKLCQLWSCEQVVLVGHSDGALVAVRAAAEASRASSLGPAKQSAQHLDRGRPIGPSPRSPGAVPTPIASPQQLSDPLLSTDTASVLGGAPSSPFSKWLQLGQPDKPQELQTQMQSTGPEAALSSISDLVAGAQEQAQPSLALGSASAAGRPESYRSAEVSTTNAAEGGSIAEAGTAPETSGSDLNITAAAEEDTQRLGRVTVQGLALLHPCMDGRVKPQIASILGHSRVGRRLLLRLLRSEIGEVSNRTSWHDSKKMTSSILQLYKGPLRVQGWDAALVEASRVRKEATLAQMNEDYVAIAGVPKLLVTGLHDHTAPPGQVKDMAEQMGGRVQSAILAGCGHLSHEEAAEDLLYHLVDFVSANV